VQYLFDALPALLPAAVDGEAYKGVVVATSVVQSGIYQADTDASDGLIMYTGEC